MQIAKLDHVNVRTQQLDTMVSWYTNVLGLKSGERPPFSIGGAWLYAGDTVVVHLVHTETHAGAGSEADLKLEHFAFTATGRHAFEKRLDQMNEHYKCTEVSNTNQMQYNVWDPDGNHIHIDFTLDD